VNACVPVAHAPFFFSGGMTNVRLLYALCCRARQPVLHLVRMIWLVLIWAPHAPSHARRKGVLMSADKTLLPNTPASLPTTAVAGLIGL
jgi:hypothetical protein